MAVILWDSDYLAYKAGFSVEHTDRAIVLTDEDGASSLYDVTDDYAAHKAALEIAELRPEGVRVFERKYLEDSAEEKAAWNIRSMVDGTKKLLEEAYPGPHDYRFYLTGTGNFRDQLATIKPYKGNRERTSRPILYSTLRKLLVADYGAETVYGIEADDIIAIKATEGRYKPIVVHVDKDLLQIPGRHFVPGKGAGKVSKEGGLVHFYRQIIAGDTADNIGGVYKSGAKRAEALITKGMTPAEMWAACVAEYQASIDKYWDETGYASLGAEKAALENARLLWLQRKHDELWEAP